MNSKIIVAVLCLLIQQRLLAQQESINLTLRGCSVQGDTLSALDPDSFNFGFDAHLEANDTLKVSVTHGRGNVARNQARFSFRSARDTIKTGFTKQLKKGDRIVFTFRLRGLEVFQKNFYIASTTYSLQKPYYYDVYFIYNEDTVKADQYILGTRMKLERHYNFKRIFFNDPREITRNFEVITRTNWMEFGISDYLIYHGKVTVQFFDKEPLIERYGYEQSVKVTDMDGEPSDKGETKSGVRRLGN